MQLKFVKVQKSISIVVFKILFSIDTYMNSWQHVPGRKNKTKHIFGQQLSSKYCVVDSVFSAIETTCLELLGVLALGTALKQCFHSSLIAQNE